MRRVTRDILFVGLVLIVAIFASSILSVVCREHPNVAAGCLAVLLLVGLFGGLLWSRNVGMSLRGPVAAHKSLNQFDVRDEARIDAHRRALAKLRYLSYAIIAIGVIRALAQVAKSFIR